MAIDGHRFLILSHANEFIITPHALDRIREKTGYNLSLKGAYSWFRQSKQLTYDQMLSSGYKPGYKRRLRDGISSWYFLLKDRDHELIAVVTMGEKEGEYEWITTYYPNGNTISNREWIDQTCMMVA